MLLRETAGELTIAQTAIDRERGVVLSEERAATARPTGSPSSALGFLLPGQRLPSACRSARST